MKKIFLFLLIFSCLLMQAQEVVFNPLLPELLDRVGGTISTSKLNVDTLSSYSNNTDLKLLGKGTGYVNITDTLKVDGKLFTDQIQSATNNTNLSLQGKGTGYVNITDTLYSGNKIGIGSATGFMSQLSVGMTKINNINGGMYNFVNTDINKNRISLLTATDSSSFNGGTTPYTGKPYLNLISEKGLRVFNIDTFYNVNLGNVTPQTRLHIDNGTSRENYIHVTGGSTTGTDRYSGTDFGIDSSGVNSRIMNWENGSLIFGQSGTEKMRINPFGELMIGTTTDAGAFNLQVSGALNASTYVTAANSARIGAASLEFQSSTSLVQTIGSTARNQTTSGVALTVTSQGGRNATANMSAGALIFQNGISTGNGISQITINRNTRGTSGTTDNSRLSALIIPSQKTLLDNTNDTLFSVSLPTLAMAGGSFRYSVTATNGTDMQVHSGHVNYAAVNKGGVYTTEIVDQSTTDDANANSSGTLSETWSIATGTNTIYIIANFDSSLNPSAGNMKCYFELHNGSLQTVTIY